MGLLLLKILRVLRGLIVKAVTRMRFTLFWDITQHAVDFLTFEDETDRLGRNAGMELELRNIPEERSSRLHRGGSLKLCVVTRMLYAFFHIAEII